MNELGINDYKRTPEEEAQMNKETAARFSQGKLRIDLIPWGPLVELAKVYTYGAKKYDDDNWRKGLRWRKDVVGPLLRHLNCWLAGEVRDKESNCHHLAMVIWNAITLMEYERCNVGIDDRNPYDMHMLDDDTRNELIKVWKHLASKGRLGEYNALNVLKVLEQQKEDKES